MNCEKHLSGNAIGVDLYNQTITGVVSKTLNAIKCDSDHVPCVLVYESHNQDSRYNPLGEVCETVSAKYGTGGGNQPIVLKYERDEKLLRDELR